MPQKNPIAYKEYQKFYQRKYRNKRKEFFKQYNKEYAIKYLNKNRKRINEYMKIRNFNFKKSWEGFIPKETNCEICGKKIYFNQTNKKFAIFFDHKNNNSLIKGNPNHWLRRHKKTFENQKIWKSCDFGMLCYRCNLALPTKNRKKFIRNIIRYIWKEKYQLKRVF